MTVHKLHSCGRCFRFVLDLFLIAFLIALCASGVQSQAMPPAIQVELNPQKPLHLRVTLRSSADTRATFFRCQLPWSNRYSMIFAAVKPNGESMELALPIDDPHP